VLVENQAVGHTTLAQYSTCTHNIISNYLLNSKVGHFWILRGWADGNGSAVVTSATHQVRSGLERFLP